MQIVKLIAWLIENSRQTSNKMENGNQLDYQEQLSESEAKLLLEDIIFHLIVAAEQSPQISPNGFRCIKIPKDLYAANLQQALCFEERFRIAKEAVNYTGLNWDDQDVSSIEDPYLYIIYHS